MTNLRHDATLFGHPWRLCISLLLLLGGVQLAYETADAQPTNVVYLVRITDEIDLGLAPFLARVLDQANDAAARAVILEIDTPGGRLDAALQIRTTILDSRVRTIAYVNREALSAGALIAIAADEIYMAPGAVIGAATPVDGAGEPADAKTISAVRSIFRATAELRERDARVAEAMVDPEVKIAGLVEGGQLLTLTAEQARDVGYADRIVEDRPALLATADLAGATLEEPEPRLAENVVRFLTRSVVASVLISLGMLLILADLLVGGFGVVGGVGLLLIGLFFWGHFLVGLAGWEGVALVVLGVVLMALEIAVVPGFGITGLLGLAALLGGVFISLIGRDLVTDVDLVRAASTVLGSLVLLILGALVLLAFLPRAARLQGLILQSRVGVVAPQPLSAHRAKRSSWITGERLEAHSVPRAGTHDSQPQRHLRRGALGVALSDLRPSGFADIDGERVDVVSRGDYIRAGERIEVIADDEYRRVVRRVDDIRRSPGAAPDDDN